jgi:16S rRNA (guanine966-N2)-methyltransferase
MRIAGGEFKGRIIKVPKFPNIRPSTERIREAIFSVLGTDIIDSNVADLFCGSGALGLEALSRGAERALFVDLHRNSTAVVRDNIKFLELESRTIILNMNVLDIRASHLKDINIIFADPPYHKGFCERLISHLSLQKIAWYGILVLEHEALWSYFGDDYKIAKRIDFGDSAVTFLIKFRPKSN